MRYRVVVSFAILCAAAALAWPAGVRARAAQAVATPLAPYTETIPDTQVTFDMVPVPAGTFVMGSPEGEAGREADEGPQHTVKLPAFYMGKIEVTWDEYDQFGFSLDLQRKRKLGTQLSKEGADAVSRPTPPYADESWGWGKEKQPVIGITHYSAVKYCEWLSAKTGKKYRLPTEAEWEYAARAGTKTAYSFGEDPSQAWRVRLVQGQLRGAAACRRAEEAECVGPARHARQRRRVDGRRVRRRNSTRRPAPSLGGAVQRRRRRAVPARRARRFVGRRPRPPAQRGAALIRREVEPP